MYVYVRTIPNNVCAQVSKFRDLVKAIKPETIVAMANAGQSVCDVFSI